MTDVFWFLFVVAALGTAGVIGLLSIIVLAIEVAADT